jgi:hypothetical protein|tara:strand:+ start:87 stop:908 length:822 start_codon:yes stop_codon:yes gene_type:complete
MVATLSLDTITSSGAGITVDATKTFTVNGSLLSAGSTNILYKTIDHPIVEADVSGKSELIVTTTPASPRDITLPLVGVTGAATCIITVVVSLDATGTQSVRVMNGASEAWTGYQNGDFVKFCVSNGAWVVLDHKETMISSRYLTSDTAIAAQALLKITGFTSKVDIGNVWDNANNKVVSPFAGIWEISWLVSGTSSRPAICPVLYVGGAVYYEWFNTHDGNYNGGQGCMSAQVVTAASADVEFYVRSLYTSGGDVLRGGASAVQFTTKFTRTY